MESSAPNTAQKRIKKLERELILSKQYIEKLKGIHDIKMSRCISDKKTLKKRVTKSKKKCGKSLIGLKNMYKQEQDEYENEIRGLNKVVKRCNKKLKAKPKAKAKKCKAKKCKSTPCKAKPKAKAKPRAKTAIFSDNSEYEEEEIQPYKRVGKKTPYSKSNIPLRISF